MSHYSVIKSKMTNKACVVKALMDAGFTKEQIEIHDVATNLYGYQNDKRANKANIIIRRKYVGSASNDLGFALREDGTYEAIISDYDSTRYNTAWRDKLMMNYSKHVIRDKASELGYSLHEEMVNGELKITCDIGY